MRHGADPDIIGTRDSIEYCPDSFGTRAVNVNSMVNSFRKDMRLYIKFELRYRNTQGVDIPHYCSDLCGKELEQYKKDVYDIEYPSLLEEEEEEEEGENVNIFNR